jgi:hypothetical protein
LIILVGLKESAQRERIDDAESQKEEKYVPRRAWTEGLHAHGVPVGGRGHAGARKKEFRGGAGRSAQTTDGMQVFLSASRSENGRQANFRLGMAESRPDRTASEVIACG